MSEFSPSVEVDNPALRMQLLSTLDTLTHAYDADVSTDNLYFIDDLERLTEIKEHHALAFLVAVLEGNAFTATQAMKAGADHVLFAFDLEDTLQPQLELILNIWQKSADFKRQKQVLETLHAINFALQNVHDVDTLLKKVLERLPEIIPCEFADIQIIVDGKIHVKEHFGYKKRGLAHLIENSVFDMDDGAFKQLLETRHAILIPDTRQFEGWIQVEGIPTRSYLGITLRSHHKVLGLLNLNHSNVNHFTKQDAQILEMYASFFSSLLNNLYLSAQFIRHTVELEERINDLLNIAAVVHRINSTLNAYEIYQVLVNEIGRRMFHSQSVIILSNEKQLKCVYVLEDGKEIEPDEFVLEAQYYYGVQEVLRNGQPAVTPEAVYEPLHSYERITGVIVVKLTSDREIEFNQVQRTILSTLSVLAGIALENAYLYETIYRQLGEMSALYEATEILFTADDMTDLAQQITATVINKFKHSDCSLYVYDKESECLNVLAQAGNYNAKRMETLCINKHTGLMVESFKTQQLVYAADVTKDPKYFNADDRTKSELVIPLKTPQQVLGILDLQSHKKDAFSESDTRVLQNYASRVAYALQSGQYFEMLAKNNLELDRRVKKRTAELADALHREQAISQMRAQFVERVSHQFRTPMTAILTANQMLEQYGDRMTDEQRQQRFDSARDAIWEMERLLDDALMINDLNVDLLGISESVLDVIDLTNTLIQEFREREGANHNVIFTPFDHAVYVKMDMNLWRRILKEILLNAVNYSESETDVTVKLQETDTHFVLSVADQGEGILPQDIDKVFDVFYRSDHVQNIRGTGLGLPIVKRAVELYGGTVDLHSEVGAGTQVTVTLVKTTL